MANGVFFVPVADRAAANAFMESIGRGEDNLNIPLGSDGNTVTHYAAVSQVGPEFKAMLDQAEEGGIPSAAALLSVLTYSLDPPEEPNPSFYRTPRAHFEAVLESEGLAEIDLQS